MIGSRAGAGTMEPSGIVEVPLVALTLFLEMR